MRFRLRDCWRVHYFDDDSAVAYKAFCGELFALRLGVAEVLRGLADASMTDAELLESFVADMGQEERARVSDEFRQVCVSLVDELRLLEPVSL